MLRYCPNCKKSFDFSPLAVSGKDDLICPECGLVIDKNSRPPSQGRDSEKIETGIGAAFATLFRLAYIFYMVIALAAIAGYFLKSDTLLYIATAISLVIFVLQLVTGTLIFRTGLIFIPLGALSGLLILHTLQGVCLGIEIVFLVRHVLRDIFFRFLGILIRHS